MVRKIVLRIVRTEPTGVQSFRAGALIPERRQPVVGQHRAALGAGPGIFPKHNFIALVLGATDGHYRKCVPMFGNGHIIVFGAGAAMHGAQCYGHASFGAIATLGVGVVAIEVVESVVGSQPWLNPNSY